VSENRAIDIAFLTAIAAITHARLADPECHGIGHERTAAFVRRTADLAKQGNPTFSYEWFYGACGLDPWGDLLPLFSADVGKSVKWDPDISDFRSD
jgi:hypothetical protein